MYTPVISGVEGSHCLARIMALRLSAWSPLGARTTCPRSQTNLQDCRPFRVPRRETHGPASTSVLWTIHQVLHCRQEVTHATTPACTGAPAHCRATQYTSPMSLVTQRLDSAGQATLRRNLTAVVGAPAFRFLGDVTRAQHTARRRGCHGPRSPGTRG